MTTVGSLAYSIVANSQQFTAGVAASKSELRTLKDAFVASQSSTERFSQSIDHLTQLATKFPDKAETINRAIAKMRGEMKQAQFDASTLGQVWGRLGFNIDPVNLAFTAGSTAIRAGAAAFDMAKQAAEGVVNQIEHLNQLGHRADLVGVPLRSMIGLSEAAEKLSGTDLPTFEAAFTKMAGNIAEAAMDPEGSGAKALDRLGLDPTKLSAMRPDEQFLAIADALQKVENVGERLALSKTILGKGGVELASTLAAGGDAIRAIADEEIRASQIDFVQLDKIKEAHQAMDDLGDTIKGAANVAASEFAPVVTDISASLTSATGSGEELRATIHGLADVTQNWVHGIKEGASAFQTLSSYIPQSLRDYASGVSTAMGVTAQLSRDNPATQAAVKASESKDAADKAAAFHAMEIKAELDLASAVEYANKKRADEVEKIGHAFSTMIDGVNKEIADKGKQIADSLKTPAEKLKDDLFELQDSFRLGAISRDVYDRGLSDIRDKAEAMSDINKPEKGITSAVYSASSAGIAARFGTQGTDEKQLREQQKHTKEQEQTNVLLGEVKAAILMQPQMGVVQ